MHKGVISNNSFLRPGGQRHALKLHGPEVTESEGRPVRRIHPRTVVYAGLLTAIVCASTVPDATSSP